MRHAASSCRTASQGASPLNIVLCTGGSWMQQLQGCTAAAQVRGAAAAAAACPAGVATRPRPCLPPVPAAGPVRCRNARPRTHLLQGGDELFVLAALDVEMLLHARLPLCHVLLADPSDLRGAKEDDRRILAALVRDPSEVLPCSGLGEDLGRPAGGNAYAWGRGSFRCAAAALPMPATSAALPAAAASLALRAGACLAPGLGLNSYSSPPGLPRRPRNGCKMPPAPGLPQTGEVTSPAQTGPTLCLRAPPVRPAAHSPPWVSLHPAPHDLGCVCIPAHSPGPEMVERILLARLACLPGCSLGHSGHPAMQTMRWADANREESSAADKKGT